MGLQIQIAQSVRDEEDLRSWLAAHVLNAEHAPVMALPVKVSAADARKYASGELGPVDLGGEPETGEQLLFYADGADVMIQTLEPVVGAVGVFQFTGRRGLAVEWQRTRRAGRTYSPGRFYWGPRIAHPLADRTRRLIEAIRRYVKRTASGVSLDPAPVYVGPDLASQIAAGRATLVYPNGKAISLRRAR